MEDRGSLEEREVLSKRLVIKYVNCSWEDERGKKEETEKVKREGKRGEAESEEEEGRREGDQGR